MEEKKLNSYVFFAFIISLVISGAQEFISIKIANISLITYQIKGFKIVLL